jgi:formamidopyrimidine-DNA glycosylase
MTGSFRLAGDGALEDDPYRRAVVILDDGSDVAYRDVRRFGTWRRIESTAALDAYLTERIGPDPLEHGFTSAALAGAMKGRRAPVKSLLLDQKAVAGIGNIYADEALWTARVHPRTPAADVGRAKGRALHSAIREVLERGIARQGATLRDYRNPAGGSGSMQEEFRVYGRRGKPCPRCGTTIERLVIGGRSSSICPRCQRQS